MVDLLLHDHLAPAPAAPSLLFAAVPGSTPLRSLLARPPFADAPDELDLTVAAHLDRVRELADLLLAEPVDLDELERSQPALPVLVAAKLARSRRLLLSLSEPQHLSLVFAVYKEHRRILRPEEHPNGEDFLRRKIGQLEWLFANTPHSWDLAVVDDGCPDGSGALAEAILAERPELDARVLYLAEGIAAGHPATQGLGSASESQKGGSILYGMAEAAAQERGRPHVIAYTDADLSSHLGQVGSLIHAIAVSGGDAAIGSRREPSSVVLKKGSRNERGKLFIYLWQRLLAPLRAQIDTQCGFKAFRRELVQELVVDPIERRFAFDIELLIRTELRRPGSIHKVPVAWIDSEAESATTDIGPHPVDARQRRADARPLRAERSCGRGLRRLHRRAGRGALAAAGAPRPAGHC